MDKIYTTESLAERRITIWMRIHERMLEEQRLLESERVRMINVQDKNPFRRAT